MKHHLIATFSLFHEANHVYKCHLLKHMLYTELYVCVLYQSLLLIVYMHAHSVGGTELSTSCSVLLRLVNGPLQAIVKWNMRVCTCTVLQTIVPAIHSSHLFSRSGPNWRGPTEPLGHWRDPPMLPAASTMERINHSCWSLGERVTMATLCRMHGSWMSTLGGGGR